MSSESDGVAASDYEQVRNALGLFPRPDSYLPSFEIHAAPEAIKAHIDMARERAEKIQDELGWLEGLYLRRVMEKAAGRWPA